MDLYESHKDWAEKVPPPVRKDHPPRRPAGYIIGFASVLAACAIIVLGSWLLLIVGVLVIR
jgi:hypothetical protein